MAATDRTRLGCQIFRKVIRATMETIAAMTSTSQGPWKLETRNCGTAKKKPATSTAGHTPSMPRNPANAQMSQKGTRSEKKGSCRPTMALRSSRLSPVTALRTMMGIPRAP
jgi:hypothetical protein